jgi:acyl-[acyl-carrier-protein]-phospholipid O-acyltransferase/long-chain-fatty-acid--[acyl-carrier-protein] ligase
VSVKITEVEGSAPLRANQPGMLWVKGPNVMKGYLGREDLTRSALVDGWYITGDLALVNDEGFVKITDRLSRFSKIGGEMVPHGKVEEALHEVAGTNQRTFAVTSVTDARKGEVLVVLHTYQDEQVPDLLRGLREMGLPNLFIPRKDRFLRVKQIPFLGTGKLDLKGLKQLAEEHFG